MEGHLFNFLLQLLLPRFFKCKLFLLLCPESLLVKPFPDVYPVGRNWRLFLRLLHLLFAGLAALPYLFLDRRLIKSFVDTGSGEVVVRLVVPLLFNYLFGSAVDHWPVEKSAILSF